MLKGKILGVVDEGKKVLVIVIDKLGYEEWGMVGEEMGEVLEMEEEV